MLLFAFQICVILLHSAASFYKPLYGLCTMFLLRILFPVKFLESGTSLNVICSSILLLALIFHLLTKKEKIFTTNRMETFSAIIFILFFIGIFFSNYVPINQQVFTLIKFFNTHFLPIFLVIRIIDSKEKFILFMRIYIIGFIVCCSYSVFCWITEISPWHDFIYSASGTADVLADTGTDAGIRILGTWGSSWQYTMVLSVVFCFFAFFSKKINWKSGKFLFALLVVNVLLAARRTPFVTVGFFFISLILFQKKNRFMLLASTSALVAVVVAAVYFVPALSAYKGILTASLFFWNEDVASDVGVSGSSTSLRIVQIIYVWQLIQGNILFGAGWGINEMYDEHPVQMAGWESSILQILGQNGAFGIFLYTYILYFMYKYSCRYAKDTAYQKAYIIAVSVMCILNSTFYWDFLFLGCILMSMTNRYLITDKKSEIEVAYAKNF